MTPASAGRAVAAALRRDRPLRRFLLALSKAVSGAGGAAFLSGGYLRDIAEGKPGADVDAMVAGLSHEELGKTLRALPLASLRIRKVVPAGKLFPVFRVATAWRGYVDVSVARGGDGSRGWAPFALALADSARRDFTVNSMLYELTPKGNRLAGEFVDPFGGLRDLAGRTIRCVGKAEERLTEDPLRALRALRMAIERRGYRLDPATSRAVRRLGPSILPGVPGDRLAGELLRSLSANPAGTLEELRRELPAEAAPPAAATSPACRSSRSRAQSIGPLTPREVGVTQGERRVSGGTEERPLPRGRHCEVARCLDAPPIRRSSATPPAGRRGRSSAPRFAGSRLAPERAVHAHGGASRIAGRAARRGIQRGRGGAGAAPGGDHPEIAQRRLTTRPRQERSHDDTDSGGFDGPRMGGSRLGVHG